MALYRFLFDLGQTEPILEERELPGLQHARQEAARLLAEFISTEAGAFWNTQGWQLRIQDHSGPALFEVHMFATDALATSMIDVEITPRCSGS